MNADIDDAFLQLYVALESITPSIKSSSIPDSVSFILGKDYETRIKIHREIQDLTDKRSRIVHQNISQINVSDKDYEILFDYVKKMIFHLHKNSTQYKNMEELQKKIDRLKYS